MNTINVCVSCDDNYSKYAGVVIASILKNADLTDELYIYILDGGISEQRKSEILSLKSIKDCSINFIEVDQSLFEEYKKIKTHSYVTIATYYRLKLPSLLPNIDKIIYFDCDMVINSSLKELFNTEMGNCLVAGVKDINKRMLKKNPTYVNAGMLVFDLKNMRADDTENRFLQWTKENADSIKVGDQTIINEVCSGRIKIVSDVWNVQSSNFTNRSSYTNEPKIVHFVAPRKPWHWASFSYHRDLYFKYLQLTPWKLSEEEYKHWTKDNQIASLIKYIKYRPIFFLRPRFYVAIYHTYLKEFLENIFSIKDYGETHLILRILGIKIKFPKMEYAKKRKQNLYYYYKKNNIDITTLPPAEGQLRDIQLANLVLLKELDYVCKQAGLRYWLDGGTQLGMVRHKGFVPWDDDIDVGMLREDYEKIIDAFKKFSRNPDIYAGFVRTPNNTCQQIIKVQHRKSHFLFVDIFPFDIFGPKRSAEEQLADTLRMKQYRKELEKSCTNRTTEEEVLQKINNYMKTKVLVNPIPENKNDSELVWGLEFNHIWKNWFTNYDVIFPLKQVTFEGHEFSCINNPDAFLTRVYGNYMAYPSKITMGHSMLLNLSEKDKKIITEIKNLLK